MCTFDLIWLTAAHQPTQRFHGVCFMYGVFVWVKEMWPLDMVLTVLKGNCFFFSDVFVGSKRGNFRTSEIQQFQNHWNKTIVIGETLQCSWYDGLHYVELKEHYRFIAPYRAYAIERCQWDEGPLIAIFSRFYSWWLLHILTQTFHDPWHLSRLLVVLVHSQKLT